MNGALWYTEPQATQPAQNVFWHLDQFSDQQIGRAVSGYDARMVGSDLDGLFGPNHVTLSDLAQEAYSRLDRPSFLPNHRQLGALIRTEHLVCYHCKGVKRKSGDEATEHPTGVRRAALKLGVYDFEELIACVAHDLLEDFPAAVSFDVLARSFGSRPAWLVEGVTKRPQTSYDHFAQKFWWVAARDPFLPVLKLFDVSQNLSTVLLAGDISWKKRWLAKTLGPTRSILLGSRPLLARQSIKTLGLFDYLFEQAMGKAYELHDRLDHPAFSFA